MWIPNLPVTITSAVCATAGAVCIFKDMYSGAPFDKHMSAADKTVVVTGASSGIGREVAWDFARRGAKVFMACRDMEKCEQIRRDIVLETTNKYVYCRPCDLASTHSVTEFVRRQVKLFVWQVFMACRDMEKCEQIRRDIVLETTNKYVYCRPCDLASTHSVTEFVRRFKSEEPHCHVLVNNGGVMEPPKGVTRDGFEVQLGVNHLSHFLLTNLMLDTLKASAPSTVVVVSGSAHRRGAIHKDDLNMTSHYDAPAAYAQSKLANILFAREFARRNLDSEIAVVAVDPGLTDTDLTRHMSVSKSFTRYLMYPLFWPFMKSARIGAQTIVHAALDPALRKSAGDYYVDMKKTEPSETAQDYELAQWLWKVSEKWTKLDEHRASLSQPRAA